jgi:hypothetical protein
MGQGVNICALSVGLAAFAGWTLSRFSAEPQPARWVNLLGGVCILAVFFSIVSPDDDGFLQELIRPATPSVHKIRIDLVNANHEVFPGQSKTVDVHNARTGEITEGRRTTLRTIQTWSG